MGNQENNLSRRKFLGNAVAVGAIGALGVQGIITACDSKSKKVIIPVPPDTAPDGPVLKAGLIGCGGRGSGAAIDFLNAGPNLQVTALGDVFQDRVDETRAKLIDKNKGKNTEVVYITTNQLLANENIKTLKQKQRLQSGTNTGTSPLAQ